jgi:tyrosyl-tRNA synthetase
LKVDLKGKNVDIENRINLITRPPTDEVVTISELKRLFETNSHFDHYIGLEISGLLHLGSLILTGYKINDFMKAGLKCKVFLADWHSYINNKFDGNWTKIKIAAKYYESAFKFFCPGIEIVMGSEQYNNSKNYWENLIRFSKHITLSRNTRCLTILGRSEKDNLHFAQYLYPPMQAVDIKELNLDVVHAGMDQRKVHMLAREVFPKMGWKVPVAVHHHLLPGLNEPKRTTFNNNSSADSILSSKMSKSKPWTCVFVHDSSEEIRRKLKKAWCPEGLIQNNPILEIVRFIIFHENNEFQIERPTKYGGSITFTDYYELEDLYQQKKIHPEDLKLAASIYLDKIIHPIRNHFESHTNLLQVYENE